ncbi:hypothetical protein GCM10010452_00560 [Crossiella cryophila]
MEFARAELGETLGDRITAVAKPGVRLVVDETSSGRSRFGGAGELPPGVEWPATQGVPMVLLAVLDLAELGELWDGFPPSGLLHFFCLNEEYDVWGLDRRWDGWRVLHVPDGTGVPTAVPDGAMTMPLRPVRFAHVCTVPSLDDGLFQWHGPERRLVADFVRAWRVRSAELGGWSEEEDDEHQIGGWPTVINGSPWWYAHFESLELTAAGELSEEARAEHERQTEEENWQIVLQLGTDGIFNWADGGLIYFGLPEKLLRAGRFDRTWAEMDSC